MLRAPRDVLTARFRSNSDYELVAFDQLSSLDRSALTDFASDPNFYGVLRPRTDRDLSMKAVCRNTAALFRALQTPGSLPVSVAGTAYEVINAQVAGLLLDGVLEIQINSTFVSGADAHEAIYGPYRQIENDGRLAQISQAALRFGQQLLVDDPLRLSVQLYFFNRAPVTPRWQRRLPDEAATARYLGVDAGPLAHLLNAYWRESPPRPDAQGWRRWTLRRRGPVGPPAGYDYKIYVSPALEALPEVLPTVVEILTEIGVRRFKIGADVSGLSRADKIVAYLDSFEAVDEVSRILDERLGDVPVQGVPFTADLRRDGLISWGMDPHYLPALEGRERRSWRLWVTDRLATALIQARKATTQRLEPWQFARERLGLYGIDSDTWTPLPSFQRMLEAPAIAELR